MSTAAMRGYQQAAVRILVSDTQSAFRALSRHRRSRLARGAQTTLVKADQWGRGEAVPADVAAALESGLKALQSKSAKKA
jgi:hypothetical protein